MSAVIIRFPIEPKPHPIERWDFEAEYREAMIRAGLWEQTRSERSCDSEPEPAA